MNNPNIYSVLGETLSSFSQQGNWRRFLECAGWNFKYAWSQQVLIYAQRPDSRACANREIWARLGRYVKKNVRLISIIDESNNSRMAITHIIDVSDTASPSGRELVLWSFDKENSQYVLNQLRDKTTEISLDGYVLPVSEDAPAYVRQMAGILAQRVYNPELFTFEDVEGDERAFISDSVICQVFSRCGLSSYFNDEDLEHRIKSIESDEIFAAVGGHVQNISKGILLEINQSVKEFGKNKLLNINREANNHDEQQNKLPGIGRLSDSEHSGPTDRNAGQIRNDEKNLSEGNETSDLRSNDNQRDIVAGTEIVRSTDQTGDKRVYEGNDEEKSSTTGQNQSGMGEIHELAEADSRSSDSSTDSLQLIGTLHEYDLGAGYLGNGLTVWDRNQLDKQDYKTVAHISYEGDITFYDENLPNNPAAIEQVKKWAEEEKIKNRREEVKESSVLPSEEEQIREAEVIEKQNELQFLNKEPIDIPIDTFDFSESEQENDEIKVSSGDIVTLQGIDYAVSAVGDKTITIQDVKSPLFTQEIDKDIFSILLKNSTEEDKGEVTSVIENTDAAESGNLLPETVSVSKEEDKGKKRTRRTLPQLQYAFFKKFAPEFMNRELDYISLESEGYEPLYIDRIDENRFAIAHTFIQNGDTMLDPEIVFIISDEKQEARPFSYEQSDMGIYNTVYDYDDTEYKHPDTKLERELFRFFNTWSKNIISQGYIPVRAIKRDNEAGDIEYTYENGKFVNVQSVTSEPMEPEEENIVETDIPEAVIERRSHPEREYTLFDFALPEDDEPVEIPQPVKAVPEILSNERHNYSNPYLNNHIEENYGPPRTRYANNVNAITLLKKLENENRMATPEEQSILAKYVGWGGLSEAFDESKWPVEYQELKELLTKEEYNSAKESTLTAFYTPPVVLESIYDTLRNFGFSKGNILEPACGIGNFFGMLPEDMKQSKLYGVELDSISGRIARYLYPESNVAIEGFEETNLPDNFFDVTIGNVPFGDFGVYDSKYNQYGFRIHDYFFAKGLDKLRPGGVMAYITSSGTMDKTNSNVRKYISQRADLLGAIRLPNNTFKANAGTEVTSDILFFKKRDTPQTQEPEWINTTTIENSDIRINEYFINHPEMVLGEIKEVSGPYGSQVTCAPIEGADLREQLQQAIQNVSGEYVSSINSLELDDITEEDTLPATPGVRNFSFTLVNDTVYFRENSIMHKVNSNATAEKRIKGLIGIRDILRELIDAQLDGANDQVIFRLQNQLNQEYDKFTKDFGIINSRGNDMAFSDDSSYYLLCSLEQLDDEGNFKGKADIFHKRTIAAQHSIESVDTPEEAMIVSMGERGKIDIGFMASLCNKSEDEVIRELKGKMFLVPGTKNVYEPANLYLSGNISNKIKTAKAYIEEQPDLGVNIEALEGVMPEPLGPADIEVSLGSTWIPTEYYNEFLLELMEYVPYHWRRNSSTLHYNEVSDTFSIESKEEYSINNTAKYGTNRMRALQILENTLNGREINVYDSVYNAEKDRYDRKLNSAETFAAREKQQVIIDKFHEWLWKDATRSQRLCRIYNEKFNCIVPPKFNGDTVIFHGMNPEIELRDYQKNAVARILQGGNVALAHEVGAGKTFTMIAGAMEAKHLGLTNKSLIAVPNHLVGQWAAAIYELYPTANVLASTKKDFEKNNRKKFCSRIATGDYDIVVIGHSQLERIPISRERQEALLEEQIDSIVNAIEEEKYSKDGSGLTTKTLERTKKRLETRLKKLQDKKRDDVVTFEELGVDKLFVDESHVYKNLFFYTKKNNVAGLSQTDSQRASDMYMKCRYLDEITDNKGVVFATGTLISNTIAEVFTVQNYLQHDLLQELGLDTFDKWSSTFAQATSSLELAPEGSGFRARTRFSKFFNLPELMNLFRTNVDIQTAEMLNLPLPEVKYETVVLEPSDEQREYVKGLAERAENIRGGGVDPSVDNMLCITNDGRKLALDQRLVNPEFGDNPNSKAVACADKIYELYLSGNEDKLTQTVFCDVSTPTNKEFNVYQDLKEKLMERGIPEKEIKFVHEAKTDTQKEELFSKVRSGEVRVLMGSTSKMGTGTNVQDRLVAGHDLDVPWRPSDLDQRRGRVVRFGNQNKKVHMYRYVTEGTFDAYSYQLIENKQRMIRQILNGNNPLRSSADVDDSTLSYAEIKGLATGNPLIMEKIKLEAEIQRLEMTRSRFINHQYDLKVNVSQHWPEKLQNASERIVGLRKDLEKYNNKPLADGDVVDISIEGKIFETNEQAGKEILNLLTTTPPGKVKKIGKIADFDIVIQIPDKNDNFFSPKLMINGNRAYSVEYTQTGHGTVKRMAQVLRGLQERCNKCEKEIEKYNTLIADGLKEMNNTFSKEDELKEMKEKLARIDAVLTIDNDKSNDEESKEFSSIDNMIASASLRREMDTIQYGQADREIDYQ